MSATGHSGSATAAADANAPAAAAADCANVLSVTQPKSASKPSQEVTGKATAGSATAAGVGKTAGGGKEAGTGKATAGKAAGAGKSAMAGKTGGSKKASAGSKGSGADGAGVTSEPAPKPAGQQSSVRSYFRITAPGPGRSCSDAGAKPAVAASQPEIAAAAADAAQHAGNEPTLAKQNAPNTAAGATKHSGTTTPEPKAGDTAVKAGHSGLAPGTSRPMAEGPEAAGSKEPAAVGPSGLSHAAEKVEPSPGSTQQGPTTTTATLATKAAIGAALGAATDAGTSTGTAVADAVTGTAADSAPGLGTGAVDAATGTVADAATASAVAEAELVPSTAPTPALPIHPFFAKRTARPPKPDSSTANAQQASASTPAVDAATAAPSAPLQAVNAAVQVTDAVALQKGQPGMQQTAGETASAVQQAPAMAQAVADAPADQPTTNSNDPVQADAALPAGRRKRGRPPKKVEAAAGPAKAAKGKQGKHAGPVRDQDRVEDTGDDRGTRCADAETEKLGGQQPASSAQTLAEMASDQARITTEGSNEAAEPVAGKQANVDASSPRAKRPRKSAKVATSEVVMLDASPATGAHIAAADSAGVEQSAQIKDGHPASAVLLQVADQQQGKPGQLQTGSMDAADDEVNDVTMVEVVPSSLQPSPEEAHDATAEGGASKAGQCVAAPRTRRRNTQQQEQQVGQQKQQEQQVGQQKQQEQQVGQQKQQEQQAGQQLDAATDGGQPVLQQEEQQVGPRKGPSRRKREEPPAQASSSPGRTRTRRQAGVTASKDVATKQGTQEQTEQEPRRQAKPVLIDITKDEVVPNGTVEPVTVDLVDCEQPGPDGGTTDTAGNTQAGGSEAAATNAQPAVQAGAAAASQQNGNKQQAAVCAMFLPLAERKRLKQLEVAEAKKKKQEEDGQQQQQQSSQQLPKQELQQLAEEQQEQQPKQERRPVILPDGNVEQSDKGDGLPTSCQPVNPFFQARKRGASTSRLADGKPDEGSPAATLQLNSWVTRPMGIALAPVHVTQQDSCSHQPIQPQHSTPQLVIEPAKQESNGQQHLWAGFRSPGTAPCTTADGLDEARTGQPIFSFLGSRAVSYVENHSDSNMQATTQAGTASAAAATCEHSIKGSVLASTVVLPIQPDLLTQLACHVTATDAPGQSIAQLLALPRTQEHLATLMASLQDVLLAQQQAVGNSMEAAGLGSRNAATAPAAEGKPTVQPAAPQPVAPPICIDLSESRMREDMLGVVSEVRKEVVDLERDPAAPVQPLKATPAGNSTLCAAANQLPVPSAAPAIGDGVVAGLGLAADAWQEAAKSMLWPLRFQPTKVAQICGNQGPAAELKAWLDGWKASIETLAQKQVQPAPNREHSWLVSDDASWFDEEGNSLMSGDAAGSAGCTNALLLTGPSGSGKTAAVYAAAQELGYSVMEVNAGTDRDGRQLLRMFGEATRSKQLAQHGKTWAGPGGASAPAAKPTNFMGLFSGASLQAGEATGKVAGGDEKGNKGGAAGQQGRQAGKQRSAGKKRRKGRGSDMDSSEGGSNSSSEPEDSDSSDGRGKRRGSRAKRGRGRGAAGKGKGRGAKASPAKQGTGPQHKQQVLHFSERLAASAPATDAQPKQAGNATRGQGELAEEQQLAGPEMGAVGLRALSIILFEDADLLQDEDAGFIKALADLIQTTKKPIVLCTNSDSAPPGLAQLRLKQIRFQAPGYQQLLSTACLAIAAAGLGTRVSLAQVEQMIWGCLAGQDSRKQPDIRRCLQQVQLQLMGWGGHVKQPAEQPDEPVASNISPQNDTCAQQPGLAGSSDPPSVQDQGHGLVDALIQQGIADAVWPSHIVHMHSSEHGSAWSQLAGTEFHILQAACCAQPNDTAASAASQAAAAGPQLGMNAAQDVVMASWLVLLPPVPSAVLSPAVDVKESQVQATCSGSVGNTCPNTVPGDVGHHEHTEGMHDTHTGGVHQKHTEGVQAQEHGLPSAVVQRQEQLAEYAAACEIAQQQHITATWRTHVAQQGGSFLKGKSSRATSTRVGRRGGRTARTPHSTVAQLMDTDINAAPGTDTTVGQVQGMADGAIEGEDGAGAGVTPGTGAAQQNMELRLLQDNDVAMDVDDATAAVGEVDVKTGSEARPRRLRRLQAATDSSADDDGGLLDDDLQDEDINLNTAPQLQQVDQHHNTTRTQAVGSQAPAAGALPASLLQSPLVAATATPGAVDTPMDQPSQQATAVQHHLSAAMTPALQTQAQTPATQADAASTAAGLLVTPAEQVPAVGQVFQLQPFCLVLPRPPAPPRYTRPYISSTAAADDADDSTMTDANGQEAAQPEMKGCSGATTSESPTGANTGCVQSRAGLAKVVQQYLQSQPDCCSMSALASCCELLSVADVLCAPRDPVPPISRCSGPSHSMLHSCAKLLQPGMNLGIACSETNRPFPQAAPAAFTLQSFSTGEAVALQVSDCVSTFDGSDVSTAITDQLWQECVGIYSAEPSSLHTPGRSGTTIPQQAALLILQQLQNSPAVRHMLQQEQLKGPSQQLLSSQHVQQLPGWAPRPELVVACNDATLYSSLLACTQDHNPQAVVERVASLGRICKLEADRLHAAQRSLTGRALRAARTHHALSLSTAIPEHLYPTLAQLATFGRARF